jgi:hypothetical protein
MENNDSTRISEKISIMIIFLTLIIFSNVFLSAKQSNLLSPENDFNDNRLYSSKLSMLDEDNYNNYHSNEFELEKNNSLNVLTYPSIYYIIKDDISDTEFVSNIYLI